MLYISYAISNRICYYISRPGSVFHSLKYTHTNTHTHTHVCIYIYIYIFKIAKLSSILVIVSNTVGGKCAIL